MTCNRCDRKAMANLKHCKGCHAKLAEYRRRYERNKLGGTIGGIRVPPGVYEVSKTIELGYDLKSWRRAVNALASMLRTP